MNIFIILLNYNGFNDTAECIESLQKLKNDESYSLNICVVDNFSNAAERKNLKILSSKFKNTVIIFNKYNNGYAAGNNIGIDFALKNKADYIWILNNDVTVDENSLSSLIIASKNKQGFLSTKIYNYYNKQELMYFGGKIMNKTFVVEFNKKEGIKDLSSDFISGASIFANRSLWEKYKLPEEYFLYEEDIDFSINLKKNKIPIFIIANAKIYHKESASTNKLSYVKHYYFTRNKMILINKYNKNLWRYYFLIKLIFIYPFRTMRRFLKGVFYNKEYIYYSKYEFFAWWDFLIGKKGKMN